MKHFFVGHGKNMNGSYIHRVLVLETSSPTHHKFCTQPIGCTPRTAFVATEILYNDLCVVHVDCASNNTWEKILRFVLPAMALYALNTLRCMAPQSCRARLHGIACHPNGRH
eukprot:5320411-Karenia_brevis.AAC.1